MCTPIDDWIGTRSQQVNNGRDETIIIKRVHWTARNDPAKRELKKPGVILSLSGAKVGCFEVCIYVVCMHRVYMSVICNMHTCMR